MLGSPFYSLGCGKRLHDHISFNSYGDVYAHKAKLTTPLLNEVLVPSQESEKSFVCLGVKRKKCKS